MAITLTFEETGDFEALRAAEKWCKENGYSYGSLQRDANVGIMHGDCYISKWRSLSPQEQDQLDGYIHSRDFRNGSVFIFLKNVMEA